MKKQKVEHNNTSSFAKNVMTLMGGTVGANLISLMLLPFITRFFSPEAFGELGVFAAIVAILGVAACFRYEMAIVLPKRNIQAISVWWLCVIITVFYTAFVSLIIYVSEDFFIAFFEGHPVVKYIWFIPAVLLIHGIYLACNYWNTRTQNFGTVSVSKIGNQLGNSGFSLGFGVLGISGGKELIIASIIGRLFATGVQFSAFTQNLGRAIKCFRWRYVIYALKRYRKFPLFGTWSILLGVAAWQLPVILLGVLFPVAVVGFYALGLRVLQMPMNLLGNAIGQVFFQQANIYAISKDNKDKVASTALNIIEILVLLSLVPLCLLACAGPEIFAFVFGMDWREAGLYAQILMPWVFLWFLSAPFSPVFAVYERQGLQLFWNIFNFSLRVLAILIGGLYFNNAYIALGLLTLFGVGIYGAKFWITFSLIGLSFKALFNRIYSYIAWAVFVVGAYHVMSVYFSADWHHIGAVFILGLIYGFWLFCTKTYLIKKIYKKNALKSDAHIDKEMG